MAEKKPFIAARLRNPAEDAPAKGKKKKAPKPPAAPGATDWIGLACALVSFALAAVTLFALYSDMGVYATYLGKTVTEALMS